MQEETEQKYQNPGNKLFKKGQKVTKGQNQAASVQISEESKATNRHERSHTRAPKTAKERGRGLNRDKGR